MLKAEQQQFVQATNNQLLDIRNTEISYFIDFFSNFGTQCALISGFILNAVSQVPGLDSAAPAFFKYLYWISSAFALVASMHVLLCTVFINVYGQGLALRGPIGSMVRAVKGMVDETNQILIAYVLTILFFSLSTVGVYWIMFPADAAVVSTVVTVAGLYMWYHFVLRIYNRFQWNSVQETLWNENENNDPAAYLRERDPSSDRKDADERARGADSMSGDNKSKGSMLGSFFGSSSKTKSEDKDSASSGKPSTSTKLGFTYGGYISVKVKNASTLYQERWQRRYAVIVGSGLSYYSDKKSFELQPEKGRLRRRPVDLEVFTLDLVENPVDESAQYILRLTPLDEEDDRKTIEFQCDTVKETQQWIDALVIAIKIGNNQADLEKSNLEKASGSAKSVANGSVRDTARDENTSKDDDTASVSSRGTSRTRG